MATLTSKIALSVAANLAAALDVGTGAHEVAFGPTYVLQNGTGANQANELWADTRTIAASGSEDLDLSGGVSDIFGTSLAFTKIKALVVVAAAANTNDVVVGGAAANAIASVFGDVSDTIRVKPGGMVALVAPDAAGYALTAGTADLLKVANSGAGSAVSFTIVVIGVV
ncbi:hypothetical protein FHS51_001421 [Sphingobium wenxiniae]|uniref:Uncharacterized protein n=1 Tax=Sphingobium wenxiniae (strain DSM 21828 / CGMCC 1.7748 / JZ-1) TaxID=595605 RepID=A0A562KKV4_SPHWJ|nr:hypothetical protein [Sphingobium wenxiniae]MBB6191199.1 hypothetical protein [Sphingobium wenxiniae]TWH96002.1 hypothetical protein IQ35_01091 [Sphingobium wenxiniae]